MDPALLAAHPPRPLLDHRLAPVRWPRPALDPLVAIGALLVSAFSVGAAFQGPYLIPR